jgi:hypothetical protein
VSLIRISIACIGIKVRIGFFSFLVPSLIALNRLPSTRVLESVFIRISMRSILEHYAKQEVFRAKMNEKHIFFLAVTLSNVIDFRKQIPNGD